MNKNELNKFINELRRKNPEYSSNLYQPIDLVEEKLQTGTMWLITTTDLLLLVEADNDLSRIYFCARNDESLKSIIPNLNTDPQKTVMDVVGRGEKLEDLSNTLCNYGFQRSFRFIRMSSKTPTLPDIEIKNVETAIREDAFEINQIIRSTFETTYAYIPNLDEIEEDCEKGFIHVVREDNKIAAFAYIAIENHLNHCLRYFIARPEARGKGYANQLLRHGFEQLPPKGLFYLWIGTYNPTVKKYEKYGLKHDGLIDDILTVAQ